MADRLELDPRTRGYLAALWDYLQHRNGKRRPGGGGGSETAEDETEEGPPSHRQLSQRLQIPRERIPTLFATLRQLVTQCRLARDARRNSRPVPQLPPRSP